MNNTAIHENTNITFSAHQVENAHLDTIPEGTPKTASRPQCRICLEPEQQGDELVIPCNCTGSVQYIHVECFRAWINKKCQNPKNREEIYGDVGIKCELCRQNFEYNLTKETKCIEKKILFYHCKRNKLLASALVTFMVLDFVMVGALIWIAIRDQSDSQLDLKKARYFLIYVALTICLAGFIFTIYQLVKFFFRQEEYTITPLNKSKSRRSKRRNSKNEAKDGEEANISQMGFIPVIFRSNQVNAL